jgi:hypothetical protein
MEYFASRQVITLDKNTIRDSMFYLEDPLWHLKPFSVKLGVACMTSEDEHILRVTSVTFKTVSIFLPYRKQMANDSIP